MPTRSAAAPPDSLQLERSQLDDAQRPIRVVLTGFVEPPDPVREDGLQRIDAGLADLDQRLA